MRKSVRVSSPIFGGIVLAAAVLAGCASKPVPPSWQPGARDALDGYTDAYLKGDSRAADAEFARARHATASTGRPDLVAQVELVRCATHVASLEFDDCPGFATLAPDASPAQRAYASYLAGRWEGLDAALLPEQHRAVVTGGAVASITDPLSRLVAAGALLKAGRITPADIGQATETASNQGWRRPLLVWLGVSAVSPAACARSAALALIRRRIALASGQQ